MLDVKKLSRPRSPEAAVRALADAGPRAIYAAGGTMLLHAHDGAVETLVDLTSAGLEYVRLESGSPQGGRLLVGAATRISTLLRSLQAAVPAAGLIHEAARTLATHTIRNLATVGGNLVAWHFPTDLPPVFLALGATLTIRGPAGVRTTPLEALYTARREVFSRGDLIVEVAVPVDPASRGGFVKIGRKKLDVAIVCGAAVLVMDRGAVREARVALAGLGGHPIRLREVEDMLAGTQASVAAFAAAGERAAGLVETRSDKRASAAYRTKLVPVVIRRALEAAAGPPQVPR